MDRKEHWEVIYKNKQINEVSWYQPTPAVSLQFTEHLNIDQHGRIIDIGGGDSLLVDHLLLLGYDNITVLDISAAAIKRAQLRLGKDAAKVKWVVSDVTEFSSTEQYDFWHDRATFHFLTTKEQVASYLSVAEKLIAPSGKMVVGTFSDNGPEKCSGLPVKQYNENSLTTLLRKYFKKIRCITTDHLTPFNTLQNFLFCSFQKTTI
jgi:2-polyprenyl-3-methyl-5-hydroxy-6-metoxy-1,4-benzoquinol methylase